MFPSVLDDKKWCIPLIIVFRGKNTKFIEKLPENQKYIESGQGVPALRGW